MDSRPPKNKIIKRRRRKISRRKPGTKPVSHYFTMDTQGAIVKYQAEDSRQIKEHIYVKEIMPAFDALVENLINVYGFRVVHDSKEDLKLECLEFLYSAVPKFDEEKGSKAFSYFNVVAKNWLTVQSKKNTKKLQKYVSLDDRDNISATDLMKIEGHNVVPSYDDIMSKKEMKDMLDRLAEELTTRARTNNEKLVVGAIKEIIANLDDIELLSKRAVLLYIREITKLSSKQLSIVLSSLKKHYRELRKTEEFSY